MTRSRRLGVAAIVLWTAWAPIRGAEATPQGRVHIAAGRGLIQAGLWTDGALELEAGYVATRDPLLLLEIADAQLRAGAPSLAVSALRRFLDRVPPGDPRRAAGAEQLALLTEVPMDDPALLDRDEEPPAASPVLHEDYSLLVPTWGATATAARPPTRDRTARLWWTIPLGLGVGLTVALGIGLGVGLTQRAHSSEIAFAPLSLR